jgi:hypothetical protein
MTPGLDPLESRQLLSTAVPQLQGLAIAAAPADIVGYSEIRATAPHGRHGATHAAPVDIVGHPEVSDRATGRGLIATGPGPTSGGSGPASMAVLLEGAVHGSTRMQGSQIGLDGSGTVGPLGAVTSRGILEARGVAPVNYGGTITLVGSTGSVTVDLAGRGFEPTRPGQPIVLTYSIIGGTGHFQGAHGSGQAYFTPTYSGAGDGFVLTFGATNRLA